MCAVVAQITAAPATRVALVLSGRRAAVAAGHTQPVRELDVGAARVVGFQDLAYQEKEVQQAALLERRANRDFPFAFAERIALDMRMRNRIVRRRSIGLESMNLVGVSRAEPRPREADLKRTEFHSFQADRVGDGRQVPFPQIYLDLSELRG
jgi:hypothetical protein